MIFTASIVSSRFDYRESFKYFCLKNCVRQLLSVKMKDPFAYINCVPNINIYFSNQLPDGYAIRYNKSPLQETYDSFFITVEPKQKNAEINFKKILEMIDKQMPVIAATDGFFLPYKQHYNKYHASHAIIINGYDNDNQNINVIDYYDKEHYNGTLSYHDFFISWSSSNPSEANPFSGAPINNVWSFLKPITDETSNKELIKNTLVSTTEAFYGRKGKYCFVGLDGLMFLKDHIKYRVKIGLDINMERLHKSLYMYYREWMLLEDYIKFYACSIKSVELILYSIEKNLLNWNILLTYILKLSVTNRPISLEKFNTLFENTIYSEKQVYNSISNAIV